MYIGLQAEVRCMSKTEGDVLTASAYLMGASKKIPHYQVLVTDNRDTRIALFSASAYRLSQ